MLCKCDFAGVTTYRHDREKDIIRENSAYGSASELGAIIQCPIHGAMMHWGHGEWKREVPLGWV